MGTEWGRTPNHADCQRFPVYYGEPVPATFMISAGGGFDRSQAHTQFRSSNNPECMKDRYVEGILNEWAALRRPRKKGIWSRRETPQDIQNAAALEAIHEAIDLLRWGNDLRDVADSLFAKSKQMQKRTDLHRDVKQGKVETYDNAGLLCYRAFDPRAPIR